MSEQFIPLAKDNQAKPTATGHQPDASLQQPTISGKIIFERTAFIGQSFSEDDIEVLDFFKSLLSELGVRAITGERAEAGSVSEKVKARIAQGEIFVGILTRREQTEDGKFRASEWIVQEIAYAAGLGKKIIILKEKDVSSIGGIHGDSEYVEFDRSSIHKSVLKLIQMIWSLNPGKVVFNKNQPPQLSVDVLEAAVAAQPREPSLRLALAQARASTGQLDAAMNILRDSLQFYPDYEPTRLEYIKTLRSAAKYVEAEKEVRKFLEAHPFSGDGHHHLAHILEAKNDITGALKEFDLSQQYQPLYAPNYRCCAVLLFRTANGNRKKLLEAKEHFETAIEIGDQQEIKNCEHWLKALKRSLKKNLPTQQQNWRRKGKRKK